ncbi:hypothetical protein GCM10018954_075050 [Kutzneria kofuensis]
MLSSRRRRAVAWAALLLVPLVVLQLRFPEPFLTPSIAATVATALRDPIRYGRDWRRITVSYVVAAAVVVPLSVAGALLALPVAATTGVAVAMAMSIHRVRFHPPAVGLSLSVGTAQVGQVGVEWSVITLATVYIVLALAWSTRGLKPATVIRPPVPRSRPRWHWCWPRLSWPAPKRRRLADRRDR